MVEALNEQVIEILKEHLWIDGEKFYSIEGYEEAAKAIVKLIDNILISNTTNDKEKER